MQSESQHHDHQHAPKPQERLVICIGDLHGYITKLRTLWTNLATFLPAHHFNHALIIFLGDYCDRGPSTNLVLDFLISLPTLYPSQHHVFLCGNHDFAFAAFLRVLPSPKGGVTFKDGWREYAGNEEREGWYKGEGYEEMHLQGRRWGGRIREKWNEGKGRMYQGSIYDAGATFAAYGVEHGSADLLNAVPDEHKRFLADLVWVHEEDDVSIETLEGKKHCKLIAVHAGLDKNKGVAEQIRRLKEKDTSVSKVDALSGRAYVWEIPKELRKEPTIVVSGHHGKLFIDGLRLIIDQGGGFEDNPVAAIVLPSMKIIRDIDVVGRP